MLTKLFYASASMLTLACTALGGAGRKGIHLVFLWLFAIGVLGVTTSDAITFDLPGYRAMALATLPATQYAPSDVAVDALGNVYVPTAPDGIRRITPAGIVTLWSTVPAVSTSLRMDASGYSTGVNGSHNCQCIYRINSDGSYGSVFTGVGDWTFILLAADGTLFANIWAGPGQGLYRIDPLGPGATLLVNGGPGPGGTGYYFGMSLGPDGDLYTAGSDGTAEGLFRFRAGAFSRVATLPHGGIGLTLDERGIFYTATTSGDSFGEVWMIDTATWTAQLLASGLAGPAGIAFDPGTKRLLVAEQFAPRTVWAISRENATITARRSWGSLKVRYR